MPVLIYEPRSTDKSLEAADTGKEATVQRKELEHVITSTILVLIAVGAVIYVLANIHA